ncbi:MAG: NAD-dependent epimerase/dehydratase family protein [Myxococcota bacterium]
MGRVVIAGGAGALGSQLARRLSATHEVLALRPPGLGEQPAVERRDGVWACDLSSIPEAEVALAGAETVVMLARARRPPARLTRAALGDLDRLLADSVARAAQRCGVKRLVLFECGEGDVRAELLAKAGVPVSVLRGGGPDPLALLAELVDAPPGTVRDTPAWTGGTPQDAGPRLRVCSVQRYPRPPGATAEDVARAYFRWLPTATVGTRVEEVGGAFTIHAFGARSLVLRALPGRSEPDSFVLQVADGALVHRTKGPGRLEFRVLLDGVTVMSVLTGYEPRLPWLIYRFSQALMHERVMRRFGEHLAALPARG